MKVKLIIVVALVSVGIGLSTLAFRSKDYTPRTSSKIEELVSYQIPGGRTAAGMAEYFASIRNNIETGTVSEEEYLGALYASLKLESKRAINTTWNELGPDNVGGRIRAFIQDRDTPSIMYAGGVSGGLFRSTTRGTSWRPVNDWQENLNISCIAQNSDGVISYGTGEGGFVSITGTPNGTPGFQGAGIFTSTDRGKTFTRIVASSSYGNINSMASEKNGQRIYAGTNTGIKYSDNGTTWSNSRNGNCIEIKVAVNGDIYAQSVNAIVKSTDRGATWTVITPPNSSISRASIAISPEDPNYVYVMASGGDSRLSGVFRTTDGGGSWTQIIAKGTTYFDPLVSGLTSPQGYYNNVITVNPKDKNHIIMGGASLAEWKEGTNPKYIASLNDFGGANPVYVHADKHVLEWDMTTTPPTLICGNDGGLFFSSDNLKTFTAKNFGFNVTQFYAVAGDYEGNVAGGTQDNGTQYVNKKGNTPKAAVEIKGGDGFQTEISVKNNSIIFSETYYGNMTRSRDFGKSQSCVWDRRIAKIFTGLTDTSKYCDFSLPSSWAPFNTKFRLWEHPEFDSTQSRIFLARYGQIWMAINPTDFQKEPEWYLIANSQGNAQVWDLEPTADGNSLFFCNSSNIFRVDGLNTATYDKWSSPNSIPPGISITTLGFSSSGRSITSINLDPNDNSTAMVTLGNYGSSAYVYKGTNMLSTASFTNITGNLPAMPVYDGFISIDNPNVLFIGTDLGVYASDDGGTTWTSQNTSTSNFPKVATMALRQYIFPNRSRGQIYAGTHGRGFFECKQFTTSIYAPKSSKSQAITAYPNPADNTVNLNFNVKHREDITITIYDLTGKVVFTKLYRDVEIGDLSINIETDAIMAGTYIVNAKGATTNAMLKLVVRH
ncbi:MAG: T9SS type A sorting domain-containing protein [Bacteroidia bacterium]|nr:T9SS type A sorting domain-containing protein [Bacteroidia bacterium]